MRLREPQGQPADLEVLGKLAYFFQIDALLAGDALLGFCRGEKPVKNNRFFLTHVGSGTGALTADELAHFGCVSTGDGPGGGQRGGRLQHRRLRGDDHR